MKKQKSDVEAVYQLKFAWSARKRRTGLRGRPKHEKRRERVDVNDRRQKRKDAAAS